MDLMKFDIISRKYEKKIQFSLKSDKNNRHCTCRPLYIVSLFCLILFILRNITHKSCIETKTHILCPVTFSANPAVSQIMWESYDRGGQATDDDIIQHMRTVRWITKERDTQKECCLPILLFKTIPLRNFNNFPNKSR